MPKFVSFVPQFIARPLVVVPGDQARNRPTCEDAQHGEPGSVGQVNYRPHGPAYHEDTYQPVVGPGHLLPPSILRHYDLWVTLEIMCARYGLLIRDRKS